MGCSWEKTERDIGEIPGGNGKNYGAGVYQFTLCLPVPGGRRPSLAALDLRSPRVPSVAVGGFTAVVCEVYCLERG